MSRLPAGAFALLVLAATAPVETAAAQGAAAVGRRVAIARLHYGGGGDWYANPSSLPNLLRAIADRTGLPVADREAVVRPLSPDLFDYPYLYMTGHGNVRFTDEELEALRRYLLAGGFLHGDDNYGMDESFRREMRRLFPEKTLVPIPHDHPVYRILYDFPAGPPKVHEHDGLPAQGLGLFHEGRLIVYYTYQSDLGDGWDDPEVHGNPPEIREAALRMGVNLFLYALSQPLAP